MAFGRGTLTFTMGWDATSPHQGCHPFSPAQPPEGAPVLLTTVIRRRTAAATVATVAVTGSTAFGVDAPAGAP